MFDAEITLVIAATALGKIADGPVEFSTLQVGVGGRSIPLYPELLKGTPRQIAEQVYERLCRVVGSREDAKNPPVMSVPLGSTPMNCVFNPPSSTATLEQPTAPPSQH